MLNTPHIIEDDDDEFDWEAAVREIDVACERGGSTAAASTSVSAFSRNEENLFRSNSRKPSAVSRQSTLDRFIQNHQSINPRNVGDFREDNIRNVVVGVGVGGGGGGGGGEDTADDNDFGDDNSGGCYCKIDLEAAKTWIYPVNIPLRNYQLSITRTALFQNTLVALPTGLGKTFIAAVVMYNYFRWFPEGKIVFAAPSRPLVLQQIEACHNIVGIPQEWAIDLTGQTSPSKRACLWKDKRVFFVTPQVLEKDIQSGICLMKYIVCLVIDEAHRASGNYSYCVAIREMMAAGLQFRLLALTATPGSKQETIQNVIDNLQISKMEYRTEGNSDVSPYVHNRKQELIRVAMGNDADEINKILLDIIRPFVEKLLSRGVFFNRGIQALSPLELVNTRDKFRGTPRLDLSQLQRDEVERWFSVLIALCHLRKVLSGHGIRPAYEFLQEKLQQGYFANLMSKNELIWKIKLKMQRSLSQGAPSPKLLKMIDILTDHFKTNDPKNSRVIIFSHFRSSVRDIMNSLSSIGDYVKATEFIGQSSGKTLKGQTQKIQQAVLQKFRDGGYNIIVATSIGEEGLDIMEVDLIISFDANISPLRMIQRMGRTGRKRDGRVVVLACEGPEINGFLRKQAISNAVKRHMYDGGEKSFKFHESFRMIPHICKPEVQFVEFSIEKFVPRGKKVHDSFSDRTFQDKLSDAEAELIVKYFRSSGEQTWKPSLIAFPHFQAFPSRVHSVTHSLRTRMLIGTMQHLQALSSLDSKALPVEVQDNKSSSQCLRAESVAQDYINEKDSVSFHGSLGTHSEKKTSKPEASGAVIFSCTEKLYVSAPPSQDLPMHCFLFEATYVSVNPFGTVSITSVPSLPFVKAVPSCKNTEGNYTDLLNIVKPKSSPPWISAGDHCELKLPSKINLTNPTETNGIYNCYMSSSRLCNSNGSEEAVLQEVENVFSTPTSKKSCIDSEVIIAETPANKRTPVLLDDKSTNDVNDIEMSPRLTNMVENGVVPESPLGEIGNHSSNGNTVRRDSNSEHVNCAFIPNCSREDGNELPKDKLLHSSDLPNCELKTHSLSPVNAPFAFRSGLPLKKLSSEMTEYVKDCKSASASEYICGSPINIDPHTPLVEVHNCVNARGNMSGSPVNEKTHTPLVNLTNSCSNDWKLSSGEASNSIQQAPKLKRLRKYGEFSKKISSETMKDKLTGPTSILIRSTTRRNPGKHIEGKRKMAIQAKAFIEEEAEVSSDAEVSEDEEEDNDNSNDDSFIDDRINPTMDTQAEAVRSDMMAIYRRSLLSQSPVESPPCCSSDLNPSIMQCIAEVDETGSCSSEKASHSFQTPQTGLQSAVRSSNLCQMDSVEISRGNIPTETSAASREERKVEGRKRKLTFQQVGYDPETSIQPQRLFQSEATGELSLQCQSENNKHDEDVFSDDQFYEGLDLDALEAQATMLLKCKSDLPVDRKQYVIPDPLTEKNQNISDSPSFDLGI